MRTYAAAAALLSLLTAAPASASHAAFEGGCGYSLSGEPTESTGEGFEALVDAEFVVYSRDLAGAPVSATVTCELAHYQPDGSARVYEFPFSGTTLVTGTGSVRLPSDLSPQDLGMCVRIVFAGDDTTSHMCAEYTSMQVPPQEVHDAVDAALAYVPGSKAAACAATAGAAPLAAGGLLVNSDGDVYAGYQRVWDC